ncbi:unnamed protein product [Rhodiola kirilowii]
MECALLRSLKSLLNSYSKLKVRQQLHLEMMESICRSMFRTQGILNFRSSLTNTVMLFISESVIPM